MSDASYQPNIYRKQGGSYLVVASGGTVTVESGGAITVDSGGTLTNAGTLANTGSVTNTGTITNSSDGIIKDTVTLNTAAATIATYGISSIGSSSAGARAYKIAAPTATYKGYRKTVICRGSSGACTLSCTAGTINNTKTKITFGANADGLAIDLIASTTANWSIVGYSTAWTTTVKAT